MHDAFVLAAGFGTRLRPLTEARPKALVPVCGIPMLAYALALCGRHGLRDVVVNAHHLADHVRAWEGVREGVRVTVSVEEPEILGTGGGLKLVADRLAPRVAVVNADVLCNVDLTALLAEVPDGGGVLALRRHADAERYGIVGVDATGTLAVMREIASAPPVGAIDRTTHFTGVHALDRRMLDLVPDGFACIIRTAYKALVPERRIRGLVHEGLWLDVGDPDAYLDANLAVLAGAPVPIDPLDRAGWARQGERERGDRGLVGAGRVEGDAWIGPRAEIGASVLRRSIVGAGARVDSAELEDCVVWDGVEVPAGRHRRVVFYPGGAVTGAR